jgi:hypothetical protein
LLVAVGLLSTQASVVAAHGSEGAGYLSQWYGVAILIVGLCIIAGAVAGKRREYLSPASALYTVLGGIAVAVVGTAIFDGFSPDPTYSAETMPFPRDWYTLISIGVGLSFAIGSLVAGWLRWRSRPRYMYLGILMALWILYPTFLPEPQSYTNPLGYAIVLGTPVLVGYIVWKDAGPFLAEILRDPVVRRFSLGIGFTAVLLFTLLTGYLDVFPDEDAPAETIYTVLPAVYQIVSWPTLEIFLPDIPFFLAVSPGMVILNGMIGVLVGLNAAVIAYEWQTDHQAGTKESVTGTAAIASSCTCGCCGPLAAKFVALGVGSSLAAPLYWLFVDNASPFIRILIMGSILLFIGVLVASARQMNFTTDATCAVPGD